MTAGSNRSARPREIYNRPASRFVAGFIGSPPMNLIEGSIDAAGAFRPATADATLPIGRIDLAGQSVTLGVRPESLHLAATPATDLAIRTTVDFVEELGASRVVHMAWSGVPLAAFVTDAVSSGNADQIAISLSRADLHLFDQGGARL